MTKAAKRTGRWTPWQLLFCGVVIPLVMLMAIAALCGATAIHQWVPQASIPYLSYLTAALFYVLAPLPVINLIGKYPLPISFGCGLLWTVLFALMKSAVWPQGSGEESSILWVILAISVLVSGLLGTRLTRR